jgi:hypothetical protein
MIVSNCILTEMNVENKNITRFRSDELISYVLNFHMKYIFVFLFILLNRPVFSQPLPDNTHVSFTQASDYKAAESQILQAAIYMLVNPYNKDDLARLNAIQFIMKWVEGTPDYGFTLGSSNTKIFKDKMELLSMYIAAMVRYALENPGSAKDPNAVSLNAMSMVLTYCNNPENNLAMTKPMKKLWEAKEQGQLAEALREAEK